MILWFCIFVVRRRCRAYNDREGVSERRLEEWIHRWQQAEGYETLWNTQYGKAKN